MILVWDARWELQWRLDEVVCGQQRGRVVDVEMRDGWWVAGGVMVGDFLNQWLVLIQHWRLLYGWLVRRMPPLLLVYGSERLLPEADRL